MNLDIEKLEKLAKAATPGPWEKDGIQVCPVADQNGALAKVHLDADARYMAAASPDAVMELIAEIARLKAVEDYLELELSGVQRAKGDLAEKLGCADEPRWKWLLSGADDLIRERYKLKAENESLRKNANRYEWLRDEHTRPGCLSSDPDKARWLNEYLMCGDQLDAAIDEQLAKVKQS